MSIICKEYLLCMLLLVVADFFYTQAMPHDPDDSCCSGGGGPPRGPLPPGPPGPPPGPPPRGMPPGGQQKSDIPTNNYINITIPATIVVQYNGSVLSATRPPKATLPVKGLPPNATTPFGLPLNATAQNKPPPNGKPPMQPNKQY